MRFSLKTMLVATTAVAVTCYSLLYATPWLGDFYYTAALATIMLGIVAAIQRQGERRAFWLGFSLVAATYVWFSIQPSLSRLPTSSTLSMQLAGIDLQDPQLVTSKLLQICYEHYCLSDKGPGTLNSNAYTRYRQVAPGQVIPQYVVSPRFQQFDSNRVAFVTIGHASLALVFGWLGGVASRRMYRSRTTQSVSP